MSPLNPIAESTPMSSGLDPLPPLPRTPQPPDLLKPPLMPCSLSLPTHVETSPRPMVTRNRRGREWSMPASEPHCPSAKLDRIDRHLRVKEKIPATRQLAKETMAQVLGNAK